MQSFLKQFSFGSIGGDKDDESTTFTSTTTTVTRYENGVPIEEVTKTYSSNNDNNNVEEVKLIEEPEENIVKKIIYEKTGGTKMVKPEKELEEPEENIVKKIIYEKTEGTKIVKPEKESEDTVEKPVNNPVTKPVNNPVTKPVNNPVTKPVNNPVTKPVNNPVTKPVNNPVTKPVNNPDKKSEGRDPDEPEFDDSTVGRQGERTDPASRCSPIVDMDEFKDFLDLTNHDFSKVDDYARGTPEEETENPTRLSKYLTKPWNEDLDKLRCIFVWIAENISYDTDAFFGGHIRSCTPDDTLKTRKSVCQGYAELFDKMASEAGLKVWKITGKSKGVGFKPGSNLDGRQYDHAWNGVLYKGEYLLIDNTWGAGHLNGMEFVKHLEPFYFLCSPTQFIYSHFPEKPEQQYIEPKLTKEEFLDLTYVKPTFFTSGLSFVKHFGNEVEVSDDKVEIEIERIHPDESKPLYAVLEWEGYNQELPVMIQRLNNFGPRGGRKYKLLCACPSEGKGDFNLFAMLEGNSGPIVASFKVKNSGSGKNYAQFVDTFGVPFSYTIHNPVHSKLNYNDNIKFEVTIFDLSDSKLPSLALFSPGKDVRDLQKVSRTTNGTTIIGTTFAVETCLDQQGKWGLTYRDQPDSLSFSFIAQYFVE